MSTLVAAGVDPRGKSGGTFRSLRVRNFRLFFGGQLISQIGNWLTLIAQALLVLKITNSGVALGLLAACQFGPVLLSRWRCCSRSHWQRLHS